MIRNLHHHVVYSRNNLHGPVCVLSVIVVEAFVVDIIVNAV
jgi:hypothetical protein